MEAMEIVIFISIALMVGGMIVGFLVDWDVRETYDGVHDIIIDDQNEVGYKKVDPEEFVVEIYNVWKACGFGTLNKTVSYYVYNPTQDEFEIDKDYIFEEVKRLNWCYSLQSEDDDCGTGNDIDFDGDIELPSVITVRCMDEEITIES